MNNKTFKHKFAVQGNFFQLQSFEKDLLELGYTCQGRSVTDFFGPGDEGKHYYITVGLHASCKSGEFTPARNDAGAGTYHKEYPLFQLPEKYIHALKYAETGIKIIELPLVLYTTEDGVIIYDEETPIYGTRKVYGKEFMPIYKGHALKEVDHYINCETNPSTPWKWFSTNEARIAWIDKQQPLLTTEDGIPKFIDDMCYTVTPNFHMYYVKDGLDEKSPWKDHKYFHRIAEAEKYIKNNIPFLSSQQFHDLWNKHLTGKYVPESFTKVLMEFLADVKRLNKSYNPKFIR